ncbi:hypothetical protein ABAC460_14190 [Asticcacaulis sp. AC460]|uniref:M10 family metallopeptidase C-terminal domain-containing protein n=1 Tax=Asticcacaulis sp. AC460 TaxID=1282360 RepID=UPI0003C3F833|nr:M10 family metallopeptidase C-terminal domain-containing protein [Asticcacaulis sp. AC460]ESQ88927.1 hypothetical protein ABAC460_14190 [Asticcacaulis sp. AC460]
MRFGLDFDGSVWTTGLVLNPVPAAKVLAPVVAPPVLSAPVAPAPVLKPSGVDAPAAVAPAYDAAPLSVNIRDGGSVGSPRSYDTTGSLNESSGPGLTARLTQYFDNVDNRYEFTGNQDIDAVLFGAKWTITNLTYSFPTSGSFYQTPYYDPDFIANQFVFNAQQQTATKYALGLVYGYTLLSFTEVTESATTHANLRLSQSSDSTDLKSAEGNFPGSETWDGDIWVGNTGQPFYSTPQIGNWGQSMLMHEIGHTLGLKHGHSDYTTLDLTVGGYIDGPGPRYGTQALPAAHDSWAYSLMTYRSTPSVGDPPFQGDQYNQPQTYMQNDIAALQYMYGAYFGHNAGNSTYSFDAFTGQMFIDGVGQGVPAQDSTRGGKIFRTIWDGNGVDTYDFSNFTGNQTIDLAPGGWSTMNAAQLADLYPLWFENPRPPGNLANALLYQNDTRSLIENANGGSGNDFLFGNLANNTLRGNGGNDQILSGDGNDSLFGGTGNDSLSAAVGDDSLSGEGGNDSLDGATGNDTIYGGLDQDAAVGGIGNDYIDGEDGDDTLSGDDGNDYLNGGTGIDSLVGGAGNDSFVVDSVYDVVVEVNGGGIDLVYASVNFTLASHFENLTLLGNLGFSATGNAANNLIYGNSGGNQLNGAGGFDTVYGLGGDDVISSSGNGYYDAGAGSDTVYAGTGSSETLIGGDGLDLLDATGTAAAYDINLNTGTTSFAGESFTGFEHVNSGSGNNVITGSGANNTINSNAGNDTVYGEGGSDIVNGGAGDDSLYGGTGSDILNAGTYASVGDVIYGEDGGDSITSSGAGTYDGGAGNDTIYAGLGSNETLIGGADTDWLITTSYSGDYAINLATGVTNFPGESFTGFENLTTGAGNDTLTGTGGSNEIHAGAGNDRIDAAVGNDTVYGDDGNDLLSSTIFGLRTYYGGNGNDTLGGGFQYGNVWDGGADSDTADMTLHNYAATINLAAGSYVTDGGQLTLLNFENVISGNQNDTLIGADGDNRLDAGGGDDDIDGGFGNDTLLGGGGNDRFHTALGGVNTYDGGSGNDTVDGSFDYGSQFDGGADIDLLDMSWVLETFGEVAFDMVSGVWGDGFSSFTAVNFENYNGAGGAESIKGTAAANWIDGGLGADTMDGGDGNDTYVVDNAADKIVEASGKGTDLVRASVSFSLTGANAEQLLLLGSAHLNATGNGLGNTLTGNSGNNVLDGAAGSDTMVGGLGDDSYYVNASGDVVTELAGEGTDTIFAAVTYSLSGKQVENLTLTGGAAIDGTGNGFANVLTGNGAVNTLDGGGGHDRLDGGAGADNLTGGTGNDTYVVDNAADAITELAGGGGDLVESSVTYTLSANIEQLTLTGTAALNGTGNDLNNVLTGNSGVNVLTGGLGNDTYYVQNTTDNVVEAGGAGTDIIFSTVTYSLNGRYAETITLTGVANINATGNSLANTLNGNDGNNTINGKGGADKLSGGLGADIFLFDAASGADKILDFDASQNDSINIHAYTNGVADNAIVTQSGSDVVITLGGGNVITVINAIEGNVEARIVW